MKRRWKSTQSGATKTTPNSDAAVELRTGKEAKRRERGLEAIAQAGREGRGGWVGERTDTEER